MKAQHNYLFQNIYTISCLFIYRSQPNALFCCVVSLNFSGDQIVGATIYFDNMSSEDTADLLKTLNRHKVGLKLQNRGDKSPGRSPLNTPLSTPCRSPMGTLTWEGKSRFGGSSPDIVLVSLVLLLFFNVTQY